MNDKAKLNKLKHYILNEYNEIGNDDRSALLGIINS